MYVFTGLFTANSLFSFTNKSGQPAKWRLISRIWNEYATPFVYNGFWFWKSQHLLWKFLHMVATRPDRAAMVRQLVLTTMRLNEEFSTHSNLQFQVLRRVRG